MPVHLITSKLNLAVPPVLSSSLISIQQSVYSMRKLRKRTPTPEGLDALPWNSSLSTEDPLSSFPVSHDLEGGFMSLEEIDESEYNLTTIPDSGKEVVNCLDEKSGAWKKTKKREREVDDLHINIGEEIPVKQKKKKKKNKDKNVSTQVVENHDEELLVDEDEFNAWHELRLHPLLMKEIYKLGYKQPTPIQQACIPAAAHRGQDIIGAAETGSGKTLAFGLPIFQRLLDEQEKVNKQTLADPEKIAPRGLLRALIITPTRELALQVTDHLKAAAKSTDFRVVAIVGGMSTEKQERLLKARPEIIVGTPGRLWELMAGGEKHLVELHSLSFFVLDEADRMTEKGHFHELQSIIDMLPAISGAIKKCSQDVQNCTTVSSFQRKKRQTLVFSATIALSADFRKKLKRGARKLKQAATDGLPSLEALSERAGMRPDVAIFDLTSESIMTSNLEESVVECSEEDKDAYLYYLLLVHGLGQTIVFFSSIREERRVAALLRTLDISVFEYHSQRQQRARLKALDRFRENKNGILVASDGAARGLHIPGVRTVIHYQLPQTAEVYVHRSGRTARASTDGCSILLLSSKERSHLPFMCKSFGKDGLQDFPINKSYMPEVKKRLSLARQINKISLKDSKEKVKDSWIKRNAESIGLDMEENDSEEERVDKCRQKKSTAMQLQKLQQELNLLLSRPLQPKFFSHRYLAGAGVSPLLQHQLEEIAQQKESSDRSLKDNKMNLVIIGQDRVEPLQALRKAGPEACLNINDLAEKHRDMEKLRRKRKEAKKRQKQQNKTDKKRRKEAATQ